MPKPDIEVSISITRAPEDVWYYLWDVSNEILWRYGVFLAQWITGSPYGIGSIGYHVVSGIGDAPWIVTECEEFRNMSWDFIDGRFKGVHSGYRISHEDMGSRMTIYTSARSNAFMKIMVFVLKGFLKRQLTGDLERLKAILEG
jgi:hypothetical protein